MVIFKIGMQKFKIVYDRQMAGDVPKLIEQFLLIADFFLRRAIMDVINTSVLVALIGFFFALSEGLNGRPIPPAGEYFVALRILLPVSMIIVWSVRMVFSRSTWPLKHRIEEVE